MARPPDAAKRAVMAVCAMLAACERTSNLKMKKAVFEALSRGGGLAGLMLAVRAAAAAANSSGLDVLMDALDCLALAVKVLRRQLGDGGCLACVQAVVDAFAGNPQVVRSEQGAAVMSKALVLFKAVAEENSNAFNALLPGILALVLDAIRPVCRQVRASCTGDALDVARTVLLAHWSWFLLAGAANAPAAAFGRGPKALDPAKAPLFFKAVNALAETLDLGASMDDLALAVGFLGQLEDRHRLFHQEFCRDVRQVVCLRSLALLWTHERDLYQEELLGLLFRAAVSDVAEFAMQTLPRLEQETARLRRVDPEQVAAACKSAEAFAQFMTSWVNV
jgi:hypothetical protein